jgi:membrane dipeptidase
VAIGTDVAYASSRSAEENRKVPSRGPSRKRWANFWAPNDPLHAPEWRQEHQVQSLAWTNWPLFTVGLVQRGYSDEDIRKIIGENVLRVAHAVFPG